MQRNKGILIVVLLVTALSGLVVGFMIPDGPARTWMDRIARVLPPIMIAVAWVMSRKEKRSRSAEPHASS